MPTYQGGYQEALGEESFPGPSTPGKGLFPSISLAIPRFPMTNDGTPNQKSPPPEGHMVSILRSEDVLAEGSILIRGKVR